MARCQVLTGGGLCFRHNDLLVLLNPALAYAKLSIITPLEMYFIYLGNKYLCCILNTCCVICFSLYKMPDISHYIFLFK